MSAAGKQGSGVAARVGVVPYNATNGWILAGAVLFFINRYLDRVYNFPILDLILPLVVLGFVMAERRVVQTTRLPTFWIMILLVIYVCFSLAINDVSPFSWWRRVVVVLTTFMPVLLFRVLRNREPLMGFSIGCIVGFSFYFISAVITDLAHGGVSRELRGLQPTPVVALAVYLCLKDKMSGAVRWTLVLSSVVSALISLAIVARGPLVSVALGLALWPVAALSRRHWILPSIAVAGFAMHFLYGLHTSAYASLIGSGQYTVSNAERAYAIDFCVNLIKMYPWGGQSPDQYGPSFAHAYDAMPGILRQTEGVLSPHNTFLEYAVFYGVPSALLLLAFLWSTLYSGGLRMSKRPLVYALIIAGVIRLGAFYGISGWIRIEWFVMLFLLFYAGAEPPTVRRPSRLQSPSLA